MIKWAHEDSNGLINKWTNLRLASHTENQRNKRLFGNNTSGCTGVYWHKSNNRWQPSISVNGKSIYLGRFIDRFDAICARKSAERKYGYHVNHGVSRPL